MTAPPRLVIDLPTFAWRAGTPTVTPATHYKTIRNGPIDQKTSRIVLDMDTPVDLQSAFLLPGDNAKPHRLVIDYVASAGSGSKEKPQSAPSNNIPTAPAKPYAPSRGFLELPDRVKDADQADIKKNAVKAPDPEQDAGKRRNVTPPRADQADDDKPAFAKGEKPMIVIDAGHGGQDPGALGAGGKREKDVTLGVAKALRDALEETGRYRVHLTRSTDVFIKLQDRVAIARAKGADLFVSLHADSVNKPDVRGASIYTLSNKASDAQTAKLAARENRADLIAGVDLSHEDKEVANILIDLAMRDTMNQSKFFANQVVKKGASEGIRFLEKPHRFAGFAVLKAPDIPSVLLEMGFMSNEGEVDQLTSPAYRRKIADAVTAGIDAYFAKVRKNQ